MTAPRWILHADMDAFYASVEQRDRPELQGQPVIVGASSGRGVVSAASYEARRFGVRSAMPGFRARELCPNGVFLPGDMKKYAGVSARVHGVFTEFTDCIEPLALDEAFLDITGSIGLLGTPQAIGKKLKARVKEETQLVVSVGIASNKLVAKMACDMGKPDGLKLVEPGDEMATLAPLPIRRLFGVGPKAEAQLLEAGVATIGALARASDATLSRALGHNVSELRQRARGLDERPVETDRSPKSIGEEATFTDDVRDQERILSALAAHSEKVASRARRSGFIGDTVVLKVKLARRRLKADQVVSNHELFPTLTRQGRLAEPGADGAEIRRVVTRLWQKLSLSEGVRLLGVTLTGLAPAQSPRQLGLFEAPPSEPGSLDAGTGRGATTKGERLGHTLDAIGDKFGAGAIRLAAEAPDKATASERHKVGDED